MKLLGWLLFPFSLLYGWMMRLRNNQFDSGQKPVTSFDRVVISVGNLSVGGTGKTPVIEYLIRLLKETSQVATVSRGYGRRTHGFRIVGDEDDAKTVGDEPLQFYRKYRGDITVAVGEERILAIPSVLMEQPEISVFLLDDAYQHRKVGRDLNIMLSDYGRPFYNDFVVPTGRLREARGGANRADCIIITKCPEDVEKEGIISKVRAYNDSSPIYFSTIHYMSPKPIFDSRKTLSKEVILITGLANASSLKSRIEIDHSIHYHFDFNDHHRFTKGDLDRVLNKVKNAGQEVSIITSEKDMVRLLSFEDHELFKRTSAFYIPIEFKIDSEEEFKAQVLSVVESKKAELN